MRSKIFCALMTVLLSAVTATIATAQPSLRGGEDPAGPRRDKTSTITPQGAYTRGRWIGLLPKGGACPAVPGWHAEPLGLDSTLAGCDVTSFEKAAADQALLRKMGLDRFCVYTAGPGAPYPFPKPARLAAAPDRMALSASADGLNLQVSPVLASAFRDQAGYAPLQLKPPQDQTVRSAPVPSVRLTFIDSQPTADKLADVPAAGSQHGYTLGHLARDLVCAVPGCAATIATRRALQYTHFTPDQVLPPEQDGGTESGHVGLISDLAQAIVAEVLRWRQEGGSRHLVINLSLGWDGELFGDLKARRVADLDPAVQAVYGALRFAAKRGVLVVAAAGNSRGGPQKSNWPLLPAAWELRHPSPWPFVLGPRLIYAVGGVDWQGLPLPNSRRGAMPRRTAYGDHAVTTVEGSPTSIYTGTSVSAAVVSSIAAVVWDLRPELRPDEVMRLVSRSGERLDFRADFYAWNFWPLSHLLPPPSMQEASLCEAVQQTCGPGAERCPALESVPQCRPRDRRPPVVSAAVLAGITPQTDTFSPTSLPSFFIPPCLASTQLLTADGLVPAAPCPANQFGSVASQRWVMPQPADDPCPGCTLLPKPPRQASFAIEARSDSGAGGLQGDTQLYALALQIGDLWRNTHPAATLVSATLDIDRYAGGVLMARTTYPISFDPATGELQTIDGLGDGDLLNGCTAQLNFVVQMADGTTMSFENPVVVTP